MGAMQLDDVLVAMDLYNIKTTTTSTSKMRTRNANRERRQHEKKMREKFDSKMDQRSA